MSDQAINLPAEPNRFDGLRPASLNRQEKDALIRLALAILTERHRGGRTLSSPDDTRAFLRMKLVDRQHEVFGAVFLDNRHRVLKVDELFQGTVDGASVHPRVVAQRALQCNAAAIVFFHNHPSGVAEPSRADVAITRRLIDAMALVDIRVLDHLVVAAGETVSMAERGLL